jgi:uncharacterized membrane protein YobD (UPF0266 family)
MNSISSPHREYTYPVLTKIVLLILLPVLLIPFFFTPDMDLTLILVLLGIFGAVVVYVFYQMTGKITLDPTGITFTRIFQEPTRLQWQEIGVISGNWTDTSVRLRDTLGERKISFSLMLQGFQDLVEQIYTQRPDLFQVQPGQEIGASPLRWLQVVFFVLFFLLFVATGVMADSPESSLMSLIFLAILGVFMVSFIAFQPSRITFEHDILRTASLIGKREIARNAILDVRLTITGGRSRHLRVRVDYHDAAAGKDKHVHLSGFAGGSPRLYGAIRAWAGITQPNRLSSYKETNFF